MRAGCIWIKIWSSCWYLWIPQYNFLIHKTRGISRLSELSYFARCLLHDVSYVSRRISALFLLVTQIVCALGMLPVPAELPSG